eukprot:13502530-Heterocapsa_arctica.AAC.1
MALRVSIAASTAACWRAAPGAANAGMAPEVRHRSQCLSSAAWQFAAVASACRLARKHLRSCDTSSGICATARAGGCGPPGGDGLCGARR